MDASALAEIGINSSPEESVLRLVKLAEQSGVDGVVASPQEAERIRATVANPKFLVVTPGIRPAGGSGDDQRRVATPEAALKAGADYLVVGRPITAAADPVAAAREISAEMERALIR
jgi:orotidine-5'-phosphate decarboxylase